MGRFAVNASHNSGGIILNQNTANLMLTPFGCVSWMGLGIFLSHDKNGEPYFFHKAGVGMQCKVCAYYKQQRGVVVMTNSEPGMEQDKALVGEIIEHVSTNYAL